MALTFFWRFENSLTLDGTHDFTAGDSVATVNDTATFNNTQSRSGYAGYYDGANDYHIFDAASIAVAAEGSVAFWVRMETWTTGTCLLRIGATATGNNQIFVRMDGAGGSGNLLFRLSQQGGSQCNLTTNSGNMGANAWYFVVLKWKSATTSASIDIYDTTGASVSSASTTTTYTSGCVPSTIDTIKLGDDGAGTGNFWLDNAFLGSSIDDAATFFTKRDITSYTEYAAAASIAPLAMSHFRRMRA